MASRGGHMDDKTYETLRLTAQTIEQVNKLNKHIITSVTIILCVFAVVFGTCSIYQTYKQYDYQYEATNINENFNRNVYEGGK